MSEVVVVIGAGSIGQAVARRVSAGKHVVLADLSHENADAAGKVMFDAGFDVSTATVDVSSRESVHSLVVTATGFGDVTGLIHAAGVSPSQASPATILAVDLYGTALVLEEFGNVIARGAAGVVIASQSGHRLGALTADQNSALANTPADELLELFHAPARPGDRPSPCLPAGKARELAARDGRGRSVGQAGRPDQHD
jgi:NAD(P)-dependent dehydrogenase (short-subunit alcohol dehydrogenase family)